MRETDTQKYTETTEINRRKLLGLLGTAAILGLAGCTSGSESGSGSDGSTGSNNENQGSTSSGGSNSDQDGSGSANDAGTDSGSGTETVSSGNCNEYYPSEMVAYESSELPFDFTVYYPAGWDIVGEQSSQTQYKLRVAEPSTRTSLSLRYRMEVTQVRMKSQLSELDRYMDLGWEEGGTFNYGGEELRYLTKKSENRNSGFQRGDYQWKTFIPVEEDGEKYYSDVTIGSFAHTGDDLPDCFDHAHKLGLKAFEKIQPRS